MYTHTFFPEKRKTMKFEGRRKDLLEMCERHSTKKTGKGNDSERMQVQ